MAGFVDRVADQAGSVRLLRLLLTLVALPFYAVGWLIAFVVVAGRWIVGAFKAGYVDAKSRQPKAQSKSPVEGG